MRVAWSSLVECPLASRVRPPGGQHPRGGRGPGRWRGGPGGCVLRPCGCLWAVQTRFNDGGRRTRPTPPTRSGVPLPTVALVLGPGEQGGGAQTKSRFRESPLRSQSLCFLACKGDAAGGLVCRAGAEKCPTNARAHDGDQRQRCRRSYRSVQFEETEFGAATFEPGSRQRVPCRWLALCCPLPSSVPLPQVSRPCSRVPSTRGPALLFPHGTLELGRLWRQRLAACSPDHSLASWAHSQSAVPAVVRRECRTKARPVDSWGENDIPPKLAHKHIPPTIPHLPAARTKAAEKGPGRSRGIKEAGGWAGPQGGRGQGPPVGSRQAPPPTP